MTVFQHPPAVPGVFYCINVKGELLTLSDPERAPWYAQSGPQVVVYEWDENESEWIAFRRGGYDWSPRGHGKTFAAAELSLEETECSFFS